MPKARPQAMEKREKRFAALWMANGRNATNTYRALYPNASPATCKSNGHVWMNKPGVIAEIKRLTDEAWSAEAMGATEVLARMARIVRLDVRDFYWKPGELDRDGEPTNQGQRKPLCELTDQQAECVKGFKYDASGRMVMEMWDKTAQIANVGKHLKLLNERLDVTLGMKLEDLVGGADEA